MLLLYVLHAFNAMLHSGADQYNWGWLGVAIVSVYIIYHLSVYIWALGKFLYQTVKAKYCKSKAVITRKVPEKRLSVEELETYHEEATDVKN